MNNQGTNSTRRDGLQTSGNSAAINRARGVTPTSAVAPNSQATGPDLTADAAASADAPVRDWGFLIWPLVALLILLAFLLLLTGCGGQGPGIVTTVHAATPGSLTLNCPAAVLLIDKPGLVKIDWGACNYAASGTMPVSAEATSDLVLTQPLRVKMIDSWIGTNAQSTGVEVGVDLTVFLPDGRERYFVNEFDKHQDVVGEQFRQWNLPLVLPAGTVLRLHTVAGVTNPSTGCPLGCGHETVWVLEDGLE